MLPLYAQAHGGAGEHSERRYMLVWPLLFGRAAPNILSRLHGEEWRGEEGVCEVASACVLAARAAAVATVDSRSAATAAPGVPDLSGTSPASMLFA